VELLEKPYFGITYPQWNSTIRFKCVEAFYLDMNIFSPTMSVIKVPRGRPQWNSIAQIPEIMS